MPLVCAHFFVFYFGILADITPPVALAAYAGSAIAKSKPMKTAVNATRLGIAAYIVPYIFAFFPILIVHDGVSPLFVVINTLMALIGLFGVSAGLQGYLFGKINPVLRIVAAIAGVCIMVPIEGMSIMSNLIGFALILAIFIFQKIIHRAKDGDDVTPTPTAA